MSEHKKVFIYVIRSRDGSPELLVLESLDEPGYEMPKGSVEEGESLSEAVHRELIEEAGISGIHIVRELGVTEWKREWQHFFLAEAPPGLPDRFEHIVTGTGIDAGLRYRFSWLPTDDRLHDSLVQGCDRFVDRLLSFVGAS